MTPRRKDSSAIGREPSPAGSDTGSRDSHLSPPTRRFQKERSRSKSAGTLSSNNDDNLTDDDCSEDDDDYDTDTDSDNGEDHGDVLDDDSLSPYAAGQGDTARLASSAISSSAEGADAKVAAQGSGNANKQQKKRMLWVLKSGEEAKLEGMDLRRPLMVRVGFAAVGDCWNVR